MYTLGLGIELKNRSLYKLIFKIYIKIALYSFSLYIKIDGWYKKKVRIFIFNKNKYDYNKICKNEMNFAITYFLRL